MELGGKLKPLANYIMKVRSNRERVEVLSCNIVQSGLHVEYIK